MPVTKDKTTASIGIPVDSVGRHYVLKNKIDFSVDNLGSGETMGIFDIPANTQVREVWAKVLTADSHATSVDIGIDGATANGFHGATSFATTGWKRDVSGQAWSPPNGYIATSPKIVALRANTAGLDAAVVEFYAECLDLNFNRVQ